MEIGGGAVGVEGRRLWRGDCGLGGGALEGSVAGADGGGGLLLSLEGTRQGSVVGVLPLLGKALGFQGGGVRGFLSRAPGYLIVLGSLGGDGLGRWRRGASHGCNATGSRRAGVGAHGGKPGRRERWAWRGGGPAR